MADFKDKSAWDVIDLSYDFQNVKRIWPKEVKMPQNSVSFPCVR